MQFLYVDLYNKLKWARIHIVIGKKVESVQLYLRALLITDLKGADGDIQGVQFISPAKILANDPSARETEDNITKVGDIQNEVHSSSKTFTKHQNNDLVSTPASHSKESTISKKITNPKQGQLSIKSFFQTLPVGMTVKEYLAREEQNDPNYAEKQKAQRARILEERERRKQLLQNKLATMNASQHKRASLLKNDSVPVFPTKNKSYGRTKEGQKPIRSELLVDGKPWRPPKLRKPKPWVTNRFYGFVMHQCKEKFGELSKRKRAELFVVRFCEVVGSAVRCKKNYEPHVQKAKVMLYKLGLIKTLNDFHVFIENYLPWEFRYKAIPTMRAFGVVTGMKSDMNKNINEDMKL